MRVIFSLGIFLAGLSFSTGQEAPVQSEPVPVALGKFEPALPDFSRPKQTTTLEKLQSDLRAKTVKSGAPIPLERDWVGEVKYSPGDVGRIRLEMGQIKNGKIYLLSIDPGGEIEIESPLLIDSIPTNEEIESCEKVEQLDAFFGKGHRGFEAWHGPDGVLGSKSWVCVAKNKKGGLDYIRVMADVFFAEEEVAHLHEVVIQEISRGTLRPANPGSEIEKMIYPSWKSRFFSREAVFSNQ